MDDLVATRNGLWLQGQFLGLDARKPVKVCLLTDVAGFRPWRHEQLITTTEIFSALQKRHPRQVESLERSALAVPIDQSFSLGDIQLKFLVIGEPSTTCVLLWIQDQHILYANQLPATPAQNFVDHRIPPLDLLLLRRESQPAALSAKRVVILERLGIREQMRFAW